MFRKRFQFRNRFRWLDPTSFARSITEISHSELRDKGIRGIIIDLDNTIVGYHVREPSAEAAAWVAAARDFEIDVVLVTNNRTPWAQGVAKNLGIACIPNARKPLPHSFRRALKLLQLPKTAAVVIGDQLFTDVLGARIAGLPVILIEPIVAGDTWHTRILRRAERVFISRRAGLSAAQEKPQA